MLTGNSIVVARGAQVKMDQGFNRVKAAIQTAVQPTMPLLGATVITSATS